MHVGFVISVQVVVLGAALIKMVKSMLCLHELVKDYAEGLSGGFGFGKNYL